MFNLLLSAFALLFSSLPEIDTNRSDPDPDVEAVFRDEQESAVSPILERPAWLKETSSDRPVFRGQDPGGMYGAPPFGVPTQPYQPINPFQSGADPVLPYLNDPGPTIVSGINGPQPERLGFTPFFDGVYISPSKAKSPAGGYFGVQEYDASLRHVSHLPTDWVFTSTIQGGARVWSGPNTPNLPPMVYRAGWDLMLSAPQAGPWGLQMDFNPSVNADFQSTLGRHSVNLDANITALYRVSPKLLLVLGVQYWERVNNIIIPNAGVVWNPTDQLELRLLFPKSRISYFLGNIGGGAHWLFAAAEYHVESYQIDMPGVSSANQIQLSDYRLSVGLRSDHEWYDKFLEVGYVMGRQAKFLHTTPGFDIGDGIMARAGVRF